MKINKDMFKQFCEGISSTASNEMKAAVEGLNIVDQTAVANVYTNVVNWFADNQLASEDRRDQALDNALESFGTDFSIQDVNGDSIVTLCRESGIPHQYLDQAAQEIALIITNSADRGYSYSDHFHPSLDYGEGEKGISLEEMFGGEMHLLDNQIGLAGTLEAFGKDIGDGISDVKLAATVALLRYHLSAIQRLLPVRPATSNMVMYKVQYNEVYDLAKSRDNDGKVRQGDHRIPFVDLYGDPSPANTTPKAIVPLVANVVDDELLEDGVLRPGKECNLFDLARAGNEIGSSTDYSDLVGEGVTISEIYLSATNGTPTTEIFKIDVSANAGARLIMSGNNTDSGDRQAMMRLKVPFQKDALKSDNGATANLGGLSASAVITVDVSVSATINLKSSIATCIGQVIADTGANEDGTALVAGDQTIADAQTWDIVGVKLDASYSEENLRKTTKAMRIMSKLQTHVIKGSANAVVQFSISEAAPGEVVDGLSRMLAVGNDDRGIQLCLSNINSVAAAINREKIVDTPIGYRVADQYITGHRIKPYMHLQTVDVSAVDFINNEKTSELLSDTRSAVEKLLLEVVTMMHNQSYYPQELGQNNTPEYTVLTSGYILNTLFNVQHMHNHMDKSSVPSGPNEYRRVLPNGTVLNFVTTTFDYMADKLMMVPRITGDAASVLNFAQNRTRGTFVAKANISSDASVRNMIVANQREQPIVLNPLAALLTFQNISTVFGF